METGILPRSSDMDEAQKGFAEDREKGYYNPLVGGVPPVLEMEDEESENLKRNERGGRVNPQQVTDVSKSPGRPLGATGQKFYSRKHLQSVIYAADDLYKFIESKVKDRYKLKRMSKQKKELVNNLCENIMTATEREKWEESALDCVEDMEKIASLNVLPEIGTIAAEHNLGFYPAALLYHSKNIEDEKE